VGGIDVSLAESLCSDLGACQGLVRIEGAGYASNLTHPEPVNRTIEAFLASLRERELV
jgi:hypothetical protein